MHETIEIRSAQVSRTSLDQIALCQLMHALWPKNISTYVSIRDRKCLRRGHGVSCWCSRLCKEKGSSAIDCPSRCHMSCFLGQLSYRQWIGSNIRAGQRGPDVSLHFLQNSCHDVIVSPRVLACICFKWKVLEMVRVTTRRSASHDYSWTHAQGNSSNGVQWPNSFISWRGYFLSWEGNTRSSTILCVDMCVPRWSIVIARAFMYVW